MAHGTPDYDVGAGSSSDALITELPLIAAGVGGGGGATVKTISAPTPLGKWITFTVPAGKQWEVLGGFFQYQTDNTIGNRVIVYEIDDDQGDRVFNMPQDGHVIPSTTAMFELVRGDINLPSGPGVAIDDLLPLPDFPMIGPLWSLWLYDTMAVSPGDVFTGRLWVRESAV